MTSTNNTHGEHSGGSVDPHDERPDDSGPNETESPSPAAPAQGGSAADRNLSRLKDILFGEELKQQQAAVQQTSTRMDAQLNEATNQLRSEFKRIQADLRSSIETLSKRLDTEQESRQASIEELEERQLAANRAQERKLAAEARLHSEALERARTRHDERFDALEQETRARFEQLLEVLSREIEAVRHAKTDRRTLAHLLTEVASGLLDEPPNAP